LSRTPGSETRPVASLRVLLASVVDYAGLFPPATLELPAAVREYAAARRGAEAWLLGRFVVAAARLEELGAAIVELGASAGPSWSLSALLADDLQADLARIAGFGDRHSARGAVEAVEAKAARVEDVDALADALPAGLEAYVEIPLATDPEPLVAALRRRGLQAKARTGGTAASAFPTPQQLARFLATCARLGVRAKATAGLHHPLRGDYPLSYAPDAPRARMFGYLNVLLAAAAARQGATDSQLVALLEEADARALQVEARGIGACGLRFSTAALERTRQDGLASFGSCSFREPLDEARALGLL
jgi:hypothetical protein